MYFYCYNLFFRETSRHIRCIQPFDKFSERIKLTASQLDPIISTHFLLAPKAHGSFELKVIGFQKLKFGFQTLFGGQLMKLLGGRDAHGSGLEGLPLWRFGKLAVS